MSSITINFNAPINIHADPVLDPDDIQDLQKMVYDLEYLVCKMDATAENGNDYEEWEVCEDCRKAAESHKAEECNASEDWEICDECRKAAESQKSEECNASEEEPQHADNLVNVFNDPLWILMYSSLFRNCAIDYSGYQKQLEEYYKNITEHNQPKEEITDEQA